MIDPVLDSITALQLLVDEAELRKGFPFEACRLRCRIYRALLGETEAMTQIAAEAARRSLGDIRHDRPLQLIWRALSLAALAADRSSWSQLGVIAGQSQRGIEREIQWKEHEFSHAFQKAVEAEITERLSTPNEVDRAGSHHANKPEFDDPADSRTDVMTSNDGRFDAIVVLRGVGNEATSEGKRVKKEYAALIEKPLPLRAMPDLAITRTQLAEEFCYAEAVIDTVLKALIGHSHIWMRPTVFLGPPGCGKTRFARRLSELLGAPFELVPCGGLSDSAIGGTARRWSSGEPSLPIMAIRRHMCANPCIILDEIEKVGSGRNNGNPHDVLLGLYENETAQRWHDPYLESHCNLRFVSWLMTANAIEPVPAVLRDRCRIIRFPEPGPGDVDVLAPRILQRLYAQTGHDPRWAIPFKGYELAALRESWRGGSIRKLERLVEGVIEARDRETLLQ